MNLRFIPVSHSQTKFMSGGWFCAVWWESRIIFKVYIFLFLLGWRRGKKREKRTWGVAGKTAQKGGRDVKSWRGSKGKAISSLLEGSHLSRLKYKLSDRQNVSLHSLHCILLIYKMPATDNFSVSFSLNISRQNKKSSVRRRKRGVKRRSTSS